jgi:prolyl-tRNA editing enzyme YbaK/EbsC (Cys-tRNA(Pro) deacylase)
VGQIVKSLVFVADDQPVLALTSGRNRVDPEKIAALRGASEARKATADEVLAATGYAIGGTPPFGHDRALPCFIDEDLMAFDRVWAAAGTPDGVFPLTPQELLRASGGSTADLAETRSAG